MGMKRISTLCAICALFSMLFSCSRNDEEETKYNPIENTTWFCDCAKTTTFYANFEYTINENIVTIKSCIRLRGYIITNDNEMSLYNMVYELHTNNYIMTLKRPESGGLNGFLEVLTKK